MTGEHEMLGQADDDAQRLRSGQVAGAAGLNVQTLRYYERRGLLDPPNRDRAGHRQFPAYTVTLLRLIKNAQRLGFSLDEISEIITANPDADVISQIAERKLVEVDREIEQLVARRAELVRLVPAKPRSVT